MLGLPDAAFIGKAKPSGLRPLPESDAEGMALSLGWEPEPESLGAGDPESEGLEPDASGDPSEALGDELADGVLLVEETAGAGDVADA